MDKSKMKNMVVLKDLPSNIVDEAIVILKPNVKLKSISKTNKDKKKDRDKKNKKETKDNSRKYIINEAEMLITNYINDIENQRKKKVKSNVSIERKYKRLKLMALVFVILFFVSCIIK